MSEMRTTSPPELLLELRREEPTALHRQLERELRGAIRSGRLRSGAAVPATRTLAKQLGLSRGVVVEAYEQLVAEGYLVSRHGSATRVAPGAVAAQLRVPASPPPSLRYDFRPGRPDLTLFPGTAWLRSVRAALNVAPAERLGYSGGHGLPELRESLAAYLDRVRGTDADPGRIVITSGVAQGLGLLCRVLGTSGARRLAMEDPSHPGSRAVVHAAGLQPVGVPVDDAGLRVDLLDQTDADAVLVTPAHQFPTGAVFSAERRAALVEWATRRGGLIIEDDYDAEYRYDREPIGSIQGLAPDRVVYAGSASKVLAPGLRLGWLVVPAWLVDAIAGAKEAADLGSPALEQLAFADFLARGELDHHLRRMRPLYRTRRDALLAGMERNLPALRPTGAAAGLHVLTRLPAGIDEAAVVARAAEVSVGVYGVGPDWISEESHPGGLVFGYAGLSSESIEAGLRLLAGATPLGSVRTRIPTTCLRTP
jgi:GntR family transcriptional regulator / MocR family aminotransferase